MKTRLTVSLVLFSALAFCGCDKSESNAGQASKVKQANVTKVAAAKITKTNTNTAATTPKGEEHKGMNCGDKSCEGENEGEGDGEAKGCNQWDEAANEVGKREIPADADWQVLKVTGMSCGGCERRIIANVGALDGVVAVEADSELSQVRVAIAPGHNKASEAASAKINELGYKVQ